MKTLVSNGGTLQPAVCTVKKSEKIFILEAGHSKATPGKRSFVMADGTQFFEYEYNRKILARVKKELDKLGIKYFDTVPEVSNEISLTERANRANKICKVYGAENCIFISIHSNAAPGSTWSSAQGWEVYTTKGQTNSDKIADVFLEEAKKVCTRVGRKIRGKKEENFTVIYKTVCPAILIEEFFYTNLDETKWLLSEEGQATCTEIIVNSIKRIALA